MVLKDDASLRDEHSAEKRAVEQAQSGSALVVVAVGASAGGLEALQGLVSNLPSDIGMAFVVAQHVSASYRSMMTDLLGRVSTIAVEAAEDGQIMQPNTVYVCPPAVNIMVGDNDSIELTPVDEGGHFPKPSIDLLFRSLARWKKERAIGIVLSGTGTDGTAGVRAIKEADGFSIAQEPDSAKYNGMPSSAINTGKVDLVMHPEEIGSELNAISLLPDRPIEEFKEPEVRDIYHRVLRTLKRVHGVDFMRYKDSTLSRRIMRRMIAKQVSTLEAYEAGLEDDEAELHELFNDLLIGVTSFFRDGEVWDLLKIQLTDYLSKKEGKLIRCWVAGCSTGEEAYSVAMLVDDVLGDAVDDYRVQIFATDISGRHIEQARRGHFPASLLTELPEGYLQRYFSPLADGLMEINKRIKQSIVFSEHDMTQDPPFLRQDLICCRNVLIYFKPELQDAVLPVFSYSLLPNALLFLGQAESLGSQTEAYGVLDAKAKIYQPRYSNGRPVPKSLAARESDSRRLRGLSGANREKSPVRQRRLSDSLESLVGQELERVLSPAAILIGPGEDIVFSHGDANPLLRRRAGLPSDNIFDNLHPDMIVDLRTALHITSGDQSVATTDFRHIAINDDGVWARLVVSRVQHPEYKGLALIYCQTEDSLEIPFGALAADGKSTDIVVQDQEKVIGKLREQLSVVVEQLDTSNAEMQSLNEELQSANEELQSSNEELETTNEELQSTNEELQTAYAELSVAFDEKQAEEAKNRELADALKRANGLLEEAEILGMSGSWRWQPSSNSLSLSRGSHRLLGLEENDPPPNFEALLDFALSEDREALESYISDIMKGKEREPLQYRIQPRKGAPIFISLNTVVRFTGYDQVETVLGTIQDINRKVSIESELLAAARRIAEKDVELHVSAEALQAAEKLRDTLQAELDGQRVGVVLSGGDETEFTVSPASQGLYIFDTASGVCSFLNATGSALLGYDQSELLALDGEAFAALIHPDDRSALEAHRQQLSTLPSGETRETDYRFRHRDGHWQRLYATETLLSADKTGAGPQILSTFFALDKHPS